ncbi:hypothetical protein BH09ACT5_BH09ACT5_19150 [soil metagenome]
MNIIALAFAALAAAGIAGSVLLIVRDGYRRIPTRRF